jgi:hypothetical protein
MGYIVWRSSLHFGKVDCHHLLEDGVVLLMVSKVDMVGRGRCWSMLVVNGSMLSKGTVETSRTQRGLVMLIIISCFWDGGKGGWGMCFINEGR